MGVLITALVLMDLVHPAALVAVTVYVPPIDASVELVIAPVFHT
jgi:hypothetical protein